MNNFKANISLNKKIQEIEKEIQPALYEQSFDTNVEKELNEKILKITMTIKDKYPELSKYIEEMEETIPNEKCPEITTNNLKTYYDSLKAMLDKYILEQSEKAN